MKPVALVMTVVHWPDDTRIRERLIRTLSDSFDVVYAARSPGPSDSAGIRYEELSGGRFARNVRALRIALESDWDVLVVHDPELILCALIARARRRRAVVFDVHEDVPGTAYTRSWVPKILRRPLAALLRWLLRVVERFLVITLAEPGYQSLFSQPHPVFVNYPDTSAYPEPAGDPAGPAVYLGDVTAERGVEEAVVACARASTSLRLIGRVKTEFRSALSQESGGDSVIFEGEVPNRDALEMLSSASVGLAPLRDLPNYRNSQPTKILEYLAMGLPVVASDLPGTRDLVEGLDAVELVPSRDSAALAEAITRARAPEVADLARRQAPQVRTAFRWPRDEVDAFYKSLV